jgi:hypothetical protein
VVRIHDWPPHVVAAAQRHVLPAAPTGNPQSPPVRRVVVASPPKRRRSPRPTSTPALAPVTSRSKGVSAWAFPGATRALAESGASWYYTWAASPAGIVSPPGVDFVPMIWGPANVTTATLDQVKAEGQILLGFNEPDLAAQANMTVQQALNLWPKLMTTGMELGSPAVAADAATPGGWLDQFMRGAAARGYRVNFITVHWYGADFATGAAVSQLKGYLRAVYDRYHLPIWLTELGLANYGGAPAFPTGAQQAAFVTAAASMLGTLHYVQRYAWFALPETSGDGSMGLFTNGPVTTTAGRAFEAAGH